MKKDSILLQVVNVEEACRIYGKARKTIMNRLDKGQLEYRKCGSTWLITIESLDKFYGSFRSKNEEKP